MYGIPNMKLDKQIIERRIELMQREGITFVTNAHVGVNTSVEDTAKGAMTPSCFAAAAPNRAI